LSKIGVTSRDRLRGCYGLAPGPVKAHEPGRMLGLAGDDLRAAMGLDVTGGFVFNAIHNLPAGAPVENIVAMLGAMQEFNGVSHVRSGKAE
jgi:hypothetical protein